MSLYRYLCNKAIIRSTAISLFCTLNEVDWNPDDIDLMNRFEDWFVRVTTNEPAMKCVGIQHRIAIKLSEDGEYSEFCEWRDGRANFTDPLIKIQEREIYAYK